MQPLISVIIPCFNVDQYIDRCLNSIINQTIGLDNLELILINDASTDRTYEKLLDWEIKYPEQIIIISNESNLRQGTCRNIGMQYVSGKYISFIDADDWIDPLMYEQMSTAMKNFDCEIVCCNMSIDYEYSNIPLSTLTSEPSLKTITTQKERCQFLFHASYPCPLMLYKHEYLLKHKLLFLENCIYEDIFFLEIIYITVTDICFLDEKFYHYYFNPTSATKNKNAKSHYDILKVITSVWDEFKHRNYFNDFREILEYRMIRNYFMIAMKIMMVRFDKFPYDMYCELYHYIHKKIPDLKTNPYLKSEIPDEWTKLCIKTLDLQMSAQQLEELAILFKNSI